LYVVAVVIEAAAENFKAYDLNDCVWATADQESSLSCGMTPAAVGTASACLKGLLRYLATAGLPAEVLQELQQQQAAAQQQLDSLRGGEAAGADINGVQRQLRSFAQAMAGRIPLSTACNNPGCMSLAQRSELLLVGGKSCVCGRCKAAR
jgi:hypothetical protein